MHSVADGVFSHFGVPPGDKWPAEIVWMFPSTMTRHRISLPTFNEELERLFRRGGVDLTSDGDTGTDQRRSRLTMSVSIEGDASTFDDKREVFIEAIMDGSAWTGTVTWDEYMSNVHLIEAEHIP